MSPENDRPLLLSDLQTFKEKEFKDHDDIDKKTAIIVEKNNAALSCLSAKLNEICEYLTGPAPNSIADRVLCKEAVSGQRLMFRREFRRLALLIIPMLGIVVSALVSVVHWLFSSGLIHLGIR